MKIKPLSLFQSRLPSLFLGMLGNFSSGKTYTEGWCGKKYGAVGGNIMRYLFK
jgi:hypothetical protein